MELRFLGFDLQESDLPWPPTSTLRILPLRSRARRLPNIFLPPTTHCWVPSWIPCRSECPLCERPSRFVSFPSSFLLTAASPRLLPFLPRFVRFVPRHDEEKLLVLNSNPPSNPPLFLRGSAYEPISPIFSFSLGKETSGNRWYF